MIDFSRLKETDPEIYDSIIDEYNRQQNGLELIASENKPSEESLLAQASYHTLKYSEGYPQKRYYAGCEVIDKTEQLAIDRACKLFNCNYANVQSHSGSSANLAMQIALCKAGDTIMGMSLNSGGHLTHGAKPTFSGKNYNSIQYDVNPVTYLIDYDEVEKLALENLPRLIICGASAYPRIIDFKRFREIVDKVNDKIIQNHIKETGGDCSHGTRKYYVIEPEIGEPSEEYRWFQEHKCYLAADIAHIAGLVATGLHPSPFPYCDVVTTTTHKTLRCVRGAIILTNDEYIAKKIDKAVFPRFSRRSLTKHYCS